MISESCFKLKHELLETIGDVKVSTFKLKTYLNFLIDLWYLLFNLENFDTAKLHDQLLEIKHN